MRSIVDFVFSGDFSTQNLISLLFTIFRNEGMGRIFIVRIRGNNQKEGGK